MKKFVLVLVLGFLLLGLVGSGQAATKVYGCTAITGGSSGALDKIDGLSLNDGDTAVCIVRGLTFTYYLDATSGVAESYPTVVAPNTNAETKRWVISSVTPSYEVDALYYGATYDSTTINAALTALGTTDKKTLLIRPGSWVMNASVTVPANVTLKVVPGATITTTGYTLTVSNGKIQAGEYSFLAGTGTIAGLKYVNVVWVGALADSGTTDNGPIIQKAFNAIVAGATVEIPSGGSGYYKVTATQTSEAITVATKCQIVLNGDLKGTSSANQHNPPYIMNVTANGVQMYGIGSFTGPGTCYFDEHENTHVPGLLRVSGTDFKLKDIKFIDPPEASIHFVGSHRSSVSFCEFTGGDTWVNANDSQFYHILISGGGNGISVHNNKFYMDAAGKSVRQGICNDSSPEVHQLSIINNYFYNMHEHAVYCYVQYSNMNSNTIIFDTAYANQRGQGIKFGGQYNIIKGNTITGALYGAIATYGAVGTVIDSNVGYNIGHVGIFVGHNVAIAYGIDRNIVSNNTLEATTTSTIYEGIRYYPGADCTSKSYGGKIINNTLKGWGDPSTSNLSSISIYSPGAGYEMFNFEVSGNTITGSLGYGIYLGRVQSSVVARNHIYDNPRANFRGVVTSNSTNLTLDRNIAEDNQDTPTLEFAFDFPTTTNVRMTDNECYGASNAAPFGHSSANNIRGRGNKTSRTSLAGSFTMNNATHADITNKNIMYSSGYGTEIGTILIIPQNAAAATAMGGAKSLYVSSITAATGFTVTTADGNAVPASNHVFTYEIMQ